MEIPFSINCLYRRRARSSGAGRDEHLEHGVGKDDGAHVAAVGDEARAGAGRPAAVRAAPRAPPGWTATRDAAALTSSLRIASVTSRPSSRIRPSAKVDVERCGDVRRAAARRPVGMPDPQRLQRDQPIERAAVEQVKSERAARRPRRSCPCRTRPDRRRRSPDGLVALIMASRRGAAMPRERGEVIGERLAHALGIVDAHRDAAERREREAHRHPVVVVGVDRRRARDRVAADDAQMVGRLPRPSRRACAARSPSPRCDRSPSRASSRCRSASSALARTARRRRASSPHRESRCNRRRCRRAPRRTAPRSSRRRNECRSHAREHVGERDVALDRAPAHAGDAHGTAADRARGRKYDAVDASPSTSIVPGTRVARAGRNAERAPVVAARRRRRSAPSGWW